MDIQCTIEPSQSDIDEIRAGLIRHNTPYLEGLFRTDIVCYVNGEHGSKIGGLVGEIWGAWLTVKYLWVNSENRGKGIGTKLLHEAEMFAESKRCHSSFLDTFSFQARPFYERHGYSIAMTLYEFPIEHERYFMTKQLR